MKELERVADQLRRAYSGPAWHGPSVMEALQDVTPEIAARHPIPTAHTIWELVHHIGAWADVPRRRILGESVEVTLELNFPPVSDTSDAAWTRSLNDLAENQRKLIELVMNLDPKRLDDPIANGPTIYLL